MFDQKVKAQLQELKKTEPRVQSLLDFINELDNTIFSDINNIIVATIQSVLAKISTPEAAPLNEVFIKAINLTLPAIEQYAEKRNTRELDNLRNNSRYGQQCFGNAYNPDYAETLLFLQRHQEGQIASGYASFPSSSSSFFGASRYTHNTNPFARVNYQEDADNENSYRNYPTWLGYR